MKKKAISLFIISILSLTSCMNWRTDIIIEGYYSGIDENHDSVPCDLYIKPISKNEYINGKGRNVIKDAINGNYFSLEFFIHFSEEDVVQFDFLNLRDAFDGATGTRISYVDDNRTWFTPQTTLNSKVLPKSECRYVVEIYGDFELGFYLYAVES